MSHTTRSLSLLETFRRQCLFSWRTTGLFAGHRWRNASAVAERECSEEKETLKLAPTAVTKLLELQKENPDSLLRVTVEGGGCSGFQYRFSLDAKREADDLSDRFRRLSSNMGKWCWMFRMFEEEDAKLLCDKVSFQFLKGSTVEFAESLMKSAFQITDNPNSETSCGCGTSFSAKM